MVTKIKLSEYAAMCRPLIKQYLKEIDDRGFTLAWNNHYKFTNKSDFLDSCVETIVRVTMENKVEKDISYDEAFELAGVTDGYYKESYEYFDKGE